MEGNSISGFDIKLIIQAQNLFQNPPLFANAVRREGTGVSQKLADERQIL
jgi:hypothetical protein